MTNKKFLIVYDWNGTLLNDTWAWCRAFNNVLACGGYAPITHKQYIAIYEAPMEHAFVAAGVPTDQAAPLLENNRALFHDTYASLVNQTKLREGAQELLATCHEAGLSQIILSNHMTGSIQKQLSDRNIASHFDDVVAVPSPEAYRVFIPKEEKLRAYIAANDIDPENVIIIGDTPEETRIAKKLGLISVAITGGNATKQRLRVEAPDRTVSSLKAFGLFLRERELLPHRPPLQKTYAFVFTQALHQSVS